jgi:hypothetical protein
VERVIGLRGVHDAPHLRLAHLGLEQHPVPERVPVDPQHRLAVDGSFRELDRPLERPGHVEPRDVAQVRGRRDRRRLRAVDQLDIEQVFGLAARGAVATLVRDPAQREPVARRAARREDRVGPRPGHDEERVRHDRRRDEPAVAPDARERLPLHRELEEARVRRVHDPEADGHPRVRAQRRLGAPVREQHVPLATEIIAEVPAFVRRIRRPVVLEQHVVEHERELRRAHRLALPLGRIHDERAVEPARHLLVRADVRVVPERPRVWHDEIVGKHFARLDRRGHHGVSIHVDGHPDPVPVNTRLLREIVVEVYDEPLASARADERAGHRAVVGPHRRRRAGQELDLGRRGPQLDLHDVRIVVRIERARKIDLGVPAGRRVDRRGTGRLARAAARRSDEERQRVRAARARAAKAVRGAPARAALS